MVEVLSQKSKKQKNSLEEFSFIQGGSLTFNDGGLLGDFRRKALGVYYDLPFPTTKDEPWRRTSIRGLKTQLLRLPDCKDMKDVSEIPGDLLKPVVGEKHGGLIAISPCGVSIEFNDEIASQGVIFTDLATANKEFPSYLEKILGKVVQPEDGKFAALASAMAYRGVFIYVPQGVQVNEPLHSVFWAAGAGIAHFSQVLVYLEDNASLTFIHETASAESDDGQTLHNGIVAFYVGENANLRYIELQSLGRHVWNFTHERVHVEKNGKVDWVFGAIGSRLTKNFSDLDLVGEGASGRMSGFYFANEDQHLDHDTQQNHFAPYTTSDLLYKGALKGHSRSVWQGMIYVAEDAQQTDGYQANRNLILSSHARADSIPGLEILANDVRCTHGATVGKIDADMIFYLQSRGVPKEEAERLIVEGFFAEIMERIPFDGVRERFQKEIIEKMA